MKYIKFLFIGIFFGIVLIKAQVASWYRFEEMFLFKSFYMYGVIGTAVLVGSISYQLITRFNLKTFYGEKITISKKPMMFKAQLFGGIVFGLGWALGGTCPGPIYAMMGAGYTIFLVSLGAALLGTIAYGAVRRYLPH